MNKKTKEKLRNEYEKEQGDLQEKHHLDRQELLRKYATKYALQNEIVRISDLQRQFLIGYNNAANLSDWLISQSYISEPDYSGIKRSLIYKLEKESV